MNLQDTLLPEFSIAIRTLIGLVFLSAAYGKMRIRGVLEGVVANYRLLPDFLVVPVAFLLPPVEALIGGLVLLGWPQLWPELAASFLLLIFAMAMAINLVRGRRHIDCGCFQSALKQTLNWGLVARNGILILLLTVPALTKGALSDMWLFLQGILAGSILFLLVQSLNLLLSIVPAWQRPHAHPLGGEK